MISRIFTTWNIPLAVSNMGLTVPRLIIIPLALVALFLIDRRKEHEDNPINITVNWFLILSIAIAWFIGLDTGADNLFIYFQF